MIHVVCAVPAERRALASLTGPEVALHVSGIGADRAARAGAVLAAAGRPRALVAAGFCGALVDDLRVGDLIRAEEVLDEARGERFPADPELLAAAPGRRGRLVSARGIARDPRARGRLDGLAVDLESAALARAARDAGIPFLALRAITDETRHRMPDFERFLDPSGRLRPLAGLIHFVCRPGEVPALVRLAPAARTAGGSLAAGLARLLEAVATAPATRRAEGAAR
jgi:adenosylhomocysteine nucleosidase